MLLGGIAIHALLLPSAGKVWPSEGGVPGSAPAEIRIFTDGTFPAGFALKLYCRTQPGGFPRGVGGGRTHFRADAPMTPKPESQMGAVSRVRTASK